MTEFIAIILGVLLIVPVIVVSCIPANALAWLIENKQPVVAIYHFWIKQEWLHKEKVRDFHLIPDVDSLIKSPHHRIDGELVPVSWTEAREKLSERLSGYADTNESGLGLGFSTELSTECVAAFMELSKDLIEVDSFAILEETQAADPDVNIPPGFNARGCELVFEAYSIYDEGADNLRKGLQNGDIKQLVLVGTDYVNQDSDWLSTLGDADNVIAFASEWDDASRKADLVIPMTGYAEQDGTFVSKEKTLQRINGKLPPLGARKTPVELATITANVLGASDQWNLRNWQSIFLSLTQHTCVLEDIDPYSIGSEGVLLEQAFCDEDVHSHTV